MPPTKPSNGLMPLEKVRKRDVKGNRRIGSDCKVGFFFLPWDLNLYTHVLFYLGPIIQKLYGVAGGGPGGLGFPGTGGSLVVLLAVSPVGKMRGSPRGRNPSRRCADGPTTPFPKPSPRKRAMKLSDDKYGLHAQTSIALTAIFLCALSTSTPTKTIKSSQPSPSSAVPTAASSAISETTRPATLYFQVRSLEVPKLSGLLT